MKNKSYADGYLPKIAYHISQSNREKIDYFIERQKNTYGELTANDLKRLVELCDELTEE